jgi:ABC-type antimicrobial peptide transport system permease subunit
MGESLYSVEGSSRAVISTAYNKRLALEGLDAAFVIKMTLQTGNETKTSYRLADTDGYLDSSSVVTFSKYTPNQNGVVVSLPALLNRALGSIPSVETMKFSRVVIKVPSNSQVGTVINVLNSALRNASLNGVTSVKNLLSVQDSLQVAVNVVNLFFTFVQLMATCICYFALSTSMSTNVHEQAKEIGILRSVGLRKFPLTRTYVWEAFVLVLAASLLGVCVGIIMGYTILLQRALFTQLPLPFVFPWIQVLALLALSFMFAWLSSWAPIRSMLNTRSITTILRRTV